MLEQQKKKKQRTLDPSSSAAISANDSLFQALFKQRAQGFRIDFAFRNAPPRPPVGPCFVGLGLDGALLQHYSRYRPHNAVEVNYSYKLHAEPDLGVSLAPSAMDLDCYQDKKTTSNQGTKPLHPRDLALLEWKGSNGDTAAEELQKRRDRARAAARLALSGQSMPLGTTGASTTSSSSSTAVAALAKKKKSYSRVLNEGLQSFMKKTTYLSNDYSRKVHDFTSLAQTKQKTAKQLQTKQKLDQERRSVKAIEESFQTANTTPPIPPHHQSNKKQQKQKILKPVYSVPLLPNVEYWGNAYTHVVMDNPPKGVAVDANNMGLLAQSSFVAHVEKKHQSARMTCQLLLPPTIHEDDDIMDDDKTSILKPVQRYDLDVVPLKEQDEPHANFCWWVSEKGATYLPISSRVQLSTGRPVRRAVTTTVARTSPDQDDVYEYQERMAEVDLDAANELKTTTTKAPNRIESDDDDDDDDDDGHGFGSTRSTIVAEN